MPGLLPRFLLTAAALFLTVQRFSTLRPIVKIGSERITVRDYEGTLEQNDRGKILYALVSSALIRQAASEAGALPTDTDVSARLEAERRSGSGVIQAAEAGRTLPLVRDLLSARIALENLRIQNISASPDEIRRYYALHPADFQKHAQAKMTLVVADTDSLAEAAAADLRDGIRPEILAEQSGLSVVGQNGYQLDLNKLGGTLPLSFWKKMHVGDIETTRLGRRFLVAQMVSAQSSHPVPLRQIAGEVSRRVRLETPWTYISARASLRARSERVPRSSDCG